MEISDVAQLVTTLSTIIGGFAILARSIYKGTYKFVEEMTRHHSDIIKPLVEDARQSAAISSRMAILEEEHKEIVIEQSHISSKLDAINKRVDETYSLLLKHMKQ